jgi:hypothetical protein
VSSRARGFDSQLIVGLGGKRTTLVNSFPTSFEMFDGKLKISKKGFPSLRSSPDDAFISIDQQIAQLMV